MTLQEKLKNIKRTSTVNGLNIYPTVDSAKDLDELWDKVIEPNLPNKSAVEQWHQILKEYISQDDAILSLANNDLSIDNIKLALSDIAFSNELAIASLL